MKEIENNRKAFESLHMNNINVLPLFEELEKFRNIEDPNSEVFYFLNFNYELSKSVDPQKDFCIFLGDAKSFHLYDPSS